MALETAKPLPLKAQTPGEQKKWEEQQWPRTVSSPVLKMEQSALQDHAQAMGSGACPDVCLPIHLLIQQACVQCLLSPKARCFASCQGITQTLALTYSHYIPAVK